MPTYTYKNKETNSWQVIDAPTGKMPFRDDGRPFTGDRAGNAREIKFSAYGELASNMPL